MLRHRMMFVKIRYNLFYDNTSSTIVTSMACRYTLDTHTYLDTIFIPMCPGSPVDIIGPKPRKIEKYLYVCVIIVFSGVHMSICLLAVLVQCSNAAVYRAQILSLVLTVHFDLIEFTTAPKHSNFEQNRKCVLVQLKLCHQWSRLKSNLFVIFLSATRGYVSWTI